MQEKSFMYLYVGIGFIIFGLAIAVLGYTNILPNLGWTGITMVLFGGLLIGLNYVPESEKEDAQAMSFGERIIKIFFAPAEVFKSFRHHPFWLGPIVIISIISGIYSVAFFYRLTPEVITNHTVEKLSESGWVKPDQIANLKKQNREINSSKLVKAGNFVTTFVGFTFLAAFLGAIYLLIILAFGGKMNYWQSVAVTAYSLFPVILIQKSLSLLILFLKEPTEIHPILGQGSLLMDNLSFLVSAGQSPVLYVVLASLSLTAFYGLFLTATGLKNAGTRVTSFSAWVATIIVWLLSLTIAVIVALLFGGLFK